VAVILIEAEKLVVSGAKNADDDYEYENGAPRGNVNKSRIITGYYHSNAFYDKPRSCPRQETNHCGAAANSGEIRE